MDLSELVHGMKPKSQRRPISGTQGGSSHHSPREDIQGSGARSKLKSGRRLTPAGSSSGHAKRSQHDRGGTSSGSSSSSPPREGPLPARSGSRSRSAARILCELCQRTFDSRTQFDQHTAVFHRRSKAPSKPREASFICPYCGKAFTSPSKRNVHQNATHMGLRPFQCQICLKSFGYKGDLTKHMATHSGIKAHSCYICGARFARNFYVKRHIETVHEKKGAQKKE